MQRTAGEFVERGGKSWVGRDIYPYEGGCACIGAIVSNKFDISLDPPVRRVARFLLWPAMNRISPAEARAFAKAILAAADWAEGAELEVKDVG